MFIKLCNPQCTVKHMSYVLKYPQQFYEVTTFVFPILKEEAPRFTELIKSQTRKWGGQDSKRATPVPIHSQSMNSTSAHIMKQCYHLPSVGHRLTQTSLI